jgi:hypothetical protein
MPCSNGRSGIALLNRVDGSAQLPIARDGSFSGKLDESRDSLHPLR